MLTIVLTEKFHFEFVAWLLTHYKKEESNGKIITFKDLSNDERYDLISEFNVEYKISSGIADKRLPILGLNKNYILDSDLYSHFTITPSHFKASYHNPWSKLNVPIEF